MVVEVTINEDPTVIVVQGPQGPPGIKGDKGNTGYSVNFIRGAGVPDNATGNNQDYYIDIVSTFIYGPKANGVWPTPLFKLQGLPGPTGAAGAAGGTGATGATPGFVAGTITVLSSSTPPTATVVLVSAGPPPIYRIDLGIPAGVKGDTGAAGAVAGVTGNIVNITDPANPIVNQVQADWDSASGLSGIANVPSPKATASVMGGLITVVAGVVTIVTNAASLPVYSNNAAAIVGTLTTGMFYRTGADPDPVCIVH